MYGPDGRLCGVLGIGRDITERKRAESERELLISAMENSSDTILITDIKGTIRYVNPRLNESPATRPHRLPDTTSNNSKTTSSAPASTVKSKKRCSAETPGRDGLSTTRRMETPIP